MNLKHLETFHHFCRLMTVSRTAEHLSVTQPAVSQQLKSFQEECGVKLFYREDDRYYLTAIGEELFSLSKHIFSRIGQIEEILRKAGQTVVGSLRIGTTKTYARTVMPDLVALFQERYPGVRVRLSEGNSADLIKRVINRQEDLAVVARARYNPALRAIPFASCEFVLVGRPDHPLALQGVVPISALRSESMIIRERGSGSRKAILAKLQQFGVTPSVLVESESLSFILAYIERRKGLAFMLSHEITEELAAGALRQITLQEGTIGFESDIVIRKDGPISEPMKYFLKIANGQMV